MAYNRGDGGYRPAGPVNFFGPMTPIVMYIILANVFVFTVLLFAPAPKSVPLSALPYQHLDAVTRWLALVPATVFPGAQVWRLFTYMFLHADFAHILFNMLTLWWFGAPLEQIWGRNRFLRYYFLTGIGAGLVCVPFYIVAGSPYSPIVGASGALFGVLMAFALTYPSARVYLWFVVPIKVKWLVIAFVVIEYMATVSYLGGGARSNVASVAHLSGMLIGYFYLRGLMDVKALFRKLKSGRARSSRFKVVRDDDDRKGPWLH